MIFPASKENHTSYRDFSFLAAGDVFFHSPRIILFPAALTFPWFCGKLGEQ